MAGKLIEPKVITDFNNKPVALLPIGFYFDDNRWELIWSEYDKKGESLTMDDLRQMFPDDESLNKKAITQNGSQLGKDFRKDDNQA